MIKAAPARPGAAFLFKALMRLYGKQEYIVPATESDRFFPDLLCDSQVDGSLEDLTEEEWTI